MSAPSVGQALWSKRHRCGHSRVWEKPRTGLSPGGAHSPTEETRRKTGTSETERICVSPWYLIWRLAPKDFQLLHINYNLSWFLLAIVLITYHPVSHWIHPNKPLGLPCGWGWPLSKMALSLTGHSSTQLCRISNKCMTRVWKRGFICINNRNWLAPVNSRIKPHKTCHDKEQSRSMQIRYTGIQNLMNREFESNFKIWQPQRDEKEGKVCVHMCMYVFVCVCVYGCVHVCIYLCMCCMCVHVHMYICVHMFICDFEEKNATSIHLTI